MSTERLRPEWCSLCDGVDFSLVVRFDTPPAGEKTFGASDYYRELWRCDTCGHFVNRHTINLDRVYEGAYRESAYDGACMAERFEKIMNLPFEQSDNRQRVARINAFADSLGNEFPRTLLDIGSGMAVFPAAMREADWVVTAVDPDPLNVAHATEAAGVEGVAGDFLKLNMAGKFGVITFNKVLEHVAPMVEMLRRAHDFLAPHGFIYIELPDGEAALCEGPERQEFFLEHFCAFSAASLALLAQRAGFRVDVVERLQEPSGKFTLRGFLSSVSNSNTAISSE